MIKQDFNKDWIVKNLSGKSRKEKKVTLPYDAMIYEERNAENPAGASCGFFPGGDYEYSKSFYVNEAEKDQTFVLEFEGIYNRGYVYVNGELAGSVHYGYTGILLDITPYLDFGANNEITVKVINSDVPNSRWYTGSGLYRPVYLYKGGSIRISENGMKISTPEILRDLAVVKVETPLKYDGKIRKTVKVTSEIADSQGHIVAEERSKVTLFDQSETVQTQRIYVKTPALWSVEEPNLYCCRVTVSDQDGILDQAESTFGIRKLELNPIDGLRINGERVLLRGGCIHHDNGPVGAAAFYRSEERRIELLKNAGFNSVRVSHNSASKALLDACDKLGMLVMEESYDVWTQSKRQYDAALVFADNWEKDMEAIVHKDFNHPCVFMYSIGNEIQNLGTPEGAKWSRRLADKIRSLDTTRYVTNAVNSLFAIMGDLQEVMMDLGLLKRRDGKEPQASFDGGINEAMTELFEHLNELATHPYVEERLSEAYGTLDLIGLNYMRGVYDQLKEFPNRVFYGSETYPPDIDLNWKEVKEYAACIGDYTWTAWDYMGEAGIGIVTYDGKKEFSKDYPAYLGYCGDLDITGYRRPISYFREIVFGIRRTPYIAVQLPEHYEKEAMHTPWVLPFSVSSWTWKGFEGKRCRAEVYSNAPEVELIVNGRSAGKLPAGEEHRFRAVFDTVYEPGEVKSIAYYADGTTEVYSLKTAKDDVNLTLKADRQEIAQDDLAYVTIELKDKHGVLQTSDDRKVSLTIEGPGCIQGFGSADPMSEENFFDKERTTYYGRAVAVIRSREQEGIIRLTAESKGMEPVTAEILVR